MVRLSLVPSHYFHSDSGMEIATVYEARVSLSLAASPYFVIARG